MLARFVRASCILAMAGTLGGARCEARDWGGLDLKALARFDFEGLALPTSIDALHRQFPNARLKQEVLDEELGLQCYEVDNLNDADVARFYYCDGQLYQFEVEYGPARVDKLGGLRAVVQKLIDTWGPADHVGESRWTWQRPMYKRRADFYAWPTGAQLTLTDLAWIPIVDRRIQRQEHKSRLNLGL